MKLAVYRPYPVVSEGPAQIISEDIGPRYLLILMGLIYFTHISLSYRKEHINIQTASYLFIKKRQKISRPYLVVVKRLF